MKRVAVDFGTSNTVVARFDEATRTAVTLEIPGVSRPLRYRLAADAPERVVHAIPSLIHYRANETLIGRQVTEQGLLDHADTIRWIKRRVALGVTKRKKTARGHVSPDQAGRDFLTILLRYLSEEISFAGDEITFTAPVEAFETFEDWLRRVAEELGVQRLRLLDEATACILGYRGAVRGDDRYLIFDFGCGTLDVAAVRVDPDSGSDRKAIELGAAGNDLGGMDIDGWLRDDFAGVHGLDAAARRRLDAVLLAEAERVKIELSDPERSVARFRVTAAPAGREGALETEYRRGCEVCERSLRAAAAPTPRCVGCLLRTRGLPALVRDTVDRALENAAIKTGLRRSDLTRVIVTGGTSLVPSVRQQLGESFGDRVEYESPFDAVVRGACQGLALSSLRHDYAIESFNRTRGDFEFKALLRRGTEYPTARDAVRFWAKGSYNGMTRIGIRIFEVSGMRRRSLDVSLVDGEGLLRDQSRVETDFDYVCLNPGNPTFIIADPPVDLERDPRRFLCSFGVDGRRRLLVTVVDRLRGATLLEDHPVVRL